ncbi:hypothetical protein FGIG_08093 [Fasciola gigantica]|uniref:Uncharacterized protein n=1 Tax=Fasciola gigantica TaxID=46835 RepID=A0A504Z0N4_FASGI|nr:hypothetical protein FGIG_08093 [Fasciola gigantica]
MVQTDASIPPGAAYRKVHWITSIVSKESQTLANMCLDRIFGCTVCSGRQCVTVCDQKSKFYANDSIYPDKSEDETFQTSMTSTGPTDVGQQAMLSATHCTLSEEKSQRQNQRIALLFCPMEEEVPNFSHSGDFESFHQSVKNIKESMPVELLYESSVCKQVEQASCLSSHLSTEINCLLTFHDNPGHQLASMNHVGDFPSESDSIGGFRSPNSHIPFRHAHVLPTIPDISTTMIIGDPPAPTSTTAGLRWTLYEQDEAYVRTIPDGSENFRPPVPTRFSLQISSEGYPPIYCSESQYGEDAGAGYTSTTREIHWTQVEKEGSQTSGQPKNPTLPLPVRFNVSSPKWVEPTCHYINSSQMDSLVSSFQDPFRENISKITARTCRFEKGRDTVSLSSITGTPTERTSTLNDQCVLQVSDEPPYVTQTLNEMSWQGEYSNQLKVPNSSVNMDYSGHPKQCTTSMLVQYSPIHLPTSFCPGSFSSTPSDQQLRCGRCSEPPPVSLRWGLTQEFREVNSYSQISKPLAKHSKKRDAILRISGTSLSHALSRFTPDGSERLAPLRIRQLPIPQPTKFVPFEHLLPPTTFCASKPSRNIKATEITRIDVNDLDDKNLTKLSLPTAGETSPISDMRNAFHYGSERLAPLRIRQLPIPQPTKFVPFEHLLPPTTFCASKPSRNIKATEITRIDVNDLDDKNLTKLSLPTAGETSPISDMRNAFHCTYIEVLIRRNLDCVASPSCLTCSESRMIYNLLDRKLQSAVAMQFLAGIQKNKKKTVLSISANVPCIPESGDSEVVGNGKPNLTDDISDFGLLERVPDTRKLLQLPKCHSKLGNCRKKACSGAYVFTQGPRYVKPPRQWLDHVHTDNSCSEYKKIVAWKLEPAKLVVGGLINYNYHLQIIVSSNDGRLGATYLQADALMNEMCKKGALYTKRKKGLLEPKRREPCDYVGDSIRMHIRTQDVSRLLSCGIEDMSDALGLDEFGLGVVAVPKRSTFSGRPKWEHVTVYTKNDLCEDGGRNRLRQVVAGIKQLRTIASELASSSANSIRRDIQPVESVDFLFRKIMATPKHILNYTKIYLTDNIVDRLREKVTLYDGTLAHCIRPTAYCPTYLYPRASDPDAYHIYACFFEPILKAMNCVSRTRLQQIPDYQLPASLQSKIILPNVISYRVRFVRNLTGYGFPAVMSLNDYLIVERICREALLSWKEEGLGSWYPLSDFKEKHPALYNGFLKKNLLMPRRSAVRKVSGVYRYWPEGRAIYVAPTVCRDCDLIVQINGEDHLKVVCVDWTGKQPYLAYSRACKLMHWLDTRICFSRSFQWGFLSSVLDNVGTGMQFSALVKFPNAAKDPDLFDRICARYQMQVRSSDTQGMAVLHNVYEIALQSTFGRTEAELAASFLHGLTRICRQYAKQPL